MLGGGYGVPKKNQTDDLTQYKFLDTMTFQYMAPFRVSILSYAA